MNPGPIGDRLDGDSNDHPRGGTEVLDRSPRSWGGTFRVYPLVAIHDPADPARRLVIRSLDFDPEIHVEWTS